MWEHTCPDRCDLEFTYEWNHTNLYLKWLVGNPQYLLNAGDSVEVSLQDVTPKEVYVTFNGNTLQLTNDGNNKWTGTIPSTWASEGTFGVVINNNGCKILLYEGLLNQSSVTSVNQSGLAVCDEFIHSGSDGITISRNSDGTFVVSTNNNLIKSSDGFLNVNNENGSYDLTASDNMVDLQNIYTVKESSDD